jgi:hypothetical protein
LSEQRPYGRWNLPTVPANCFGFMQLGDEVKLGSSSGAGKTIE